MAVEPFAPPFGSVTGAVEAYVAPSISMKLAEIGFGIGVGSAVAYQGTTTEFGLLFSPILRIGAEDGLHLRARHERRLVERHRELRQLPRGRPGSR